MGKKINTFGMDIIDIYKLVLEGKLKKFPKYTWEKPNACEDAIECTRYMIEVILNWSDDEVREKFGVDTFRNNKLDGLLHTIYGYSPYTAISAAYPGRFKPWEFRKNPHKSWTPETAIEAVKWLIEEKLQWTDDEVREKLCVKTFRNNKLTGMFALFYKNDPYMAISSAYPDRFKPCEFKNATIEASYPDSF